MSSFNINSMEDVLNLNLQEATPGFGAAHKVRKDQYHLLIENQNLRTYSTTDLLHACPRKYQLKKLAAHKGTDERINSPTFAFGHAVGAGVAVYDQTQDIDQAVWAAFLAWDIDLLAGERKPGQRAGKSFAEACWALYAYQTFYNESYLSEYEVVKVEATLAVDFEDGHFYSGHVDELLRHKETGKYCVKENKTDGGTTIDPAKYSNSDQALSYAIVIDMLGASSYTVIYTIYCVPEQRWVQFEFVKGVDLKLEWLQDQLVISQQLDDYTEMNFFPRRGRSCMAYNRRCEYYETCQFSSTNTFGMTFAELPKIEKLEDIDAIEHVDYYAKLSDIVAKHAGAPLNQQTGD